MEICDSMYVGTLAATGSFALAISSLDINVSTTNRPVGRFETDLGIALLSAALLGSSRISSRMELVFTSHRAHEGRPKLQTPRLVMASLPPARLAPSSPSQSTCIVRMTRTQALRLSSRPTPAARARHHFGRPGVPSLASSAPWFGCTQTGAHRLLCARWRPQSTGRSGPLRAQIRHCRTLTLRPESDITPLSAGSGESGQSRTSHVGQ
jgi:hypothetical protein